MESPNALLISANDHYQSLLESTCFFDKFDVNKCEESNWEHFLSEQPALVIFDANSFDENDFSQLHSLNFCPDTDFIFFSEGRPNKILDKAILRCAAYHYRTPVDEQHLNEVISEIFAENQNVGSVENVIKNSELDQFGLLFGSSRVMKKLYRNIRKIAGFDTSVLVVGESGVGKELVAHTIHSASERADKPFIAVNCGALSKELASSDLFGHVRGAFTGAQSNRDGYFSQAMGGTLFLDEVTEMPEELQVQLLRVLETGDYSALGSNKVLKANVRIIAATNRDLSEAVSDGTFREDLYFRLAQFLLHIPPLRSRQDDIIGLAKHFLAYKNVEDNTGKKITNTALDKIKRYSWPGNVRELKHTIERAYILATEVIDDEHIVVDMDSLGDPTVPTGVPLAEIEKQVILNTLEEQKGNKSNTAKVLDISVKTLYNKLDKYSDEHE